MPNKYPGHTRESMALEGFIGSEHITFGPEGSEVNFIHKILLTLLAATSCAVLLPTICSNLKVGLPSAVLIALRPIIEPQYFTAIAPVSARNTGFINPFAQLYTVPYRHYDSIVRDNRRPVSYFMLKLYNTNVCFIIIRYSSLFVCRFYLG